MFIKYIFELIFIVIYIKSEKINQTSFFNVFYRILHSFMWS